MTDCLTRCINGFNFNSNSRGTVTAGYSCHCWLQLSLLVTCYRTAKVVATSDHI